MGENRSMKHLLPITAILFLSSCTVYQVMTVSSNEVRQNGAQEFVIENDSFELCYNFNGQNGPINVRIKNKLQQPLYVDWQRSALIINNQAISYVPNKVPINGSVAATTFDWTRDFATTSGRFQATAILPAEIDFIPPQTYVTRQLIGITNQGIDRLPDSVFKKKRIPAMGDGVEVVKEAWFTAATSPLVFTSYLTMMVGKIDPKPVVCQHQFYVSQLVKMSNSPELLNGDKRGDRFYVVQSAPVDSFGYGYGVVGGRAVYRQLRSSR